MIRGLIALLTLAPAQAGAFDLAFPLDCTLGESCFIQQFVDHDPGPAAQDYTCGPLSYEGHEGTDFALPSLAAMQAGVTVRAAAAGVVLGLRDGMPDIASNDPAAPDLRGRDCGNGVVLDHGDGWQTQYCHMKQGSVTVEKGQRVETGGTLGQVGMSGRAEFPHLHVTLRQGETVVDPFDTDADLATCGQPPTGVWAPALPYQPGGLIALGITTEVPEFAAIKGGLPQAGVLPVKAPALVVWAYAFGGRAGDEIVFALTGPEGAVVSETVVLEKTQAQLFRAVGKRLRGPDGWPAGDYTGTATLLRGGTVLSEQRLTLRIEG